MNFVIFLGKLKIFLFKRGLVLIESLKIIFAKMLADARKQPITTLAVFVVFSALFFIFDNKLAALLIASIIPIIVFRWDPRIYFGFALLFLFVTPFFLIFQQEYLAEQMAIYTYYLLCAGVVCQIIEYARDNRDGGGATKEFKQWAKINISSLVLIIIVILFSVGFYYINNKFTKQLAAQNKLLMQMGGYKVEEADKELGKLKKQIKDLVDLYSGVSVSSINNLTSSSASGAVLKTKPITVEILNGTLSKGMATDLGDLLKNKGFTIISVGNANGNYTTTTIFYNSTGKNYAEAVEKEVSNFYFTQTQESSAKLNSDVLVIIGTKKK